MELLNKSTQFHFITNNNDISVSPTDLSKIFPALNDGSSGETLLPTFGHDINPLTGDRKQFPIFMTSDEKTRIELPQNRTVFISEAQEKQRQSIEIKSLISKINSLYPEKKANRIAILNTFIINCSEDEFQETYRKIFKYNTTPIEWDNRVVTRERALEENINIVSSIRRSKILNQFTNNGQETDVLIIEIDTNTLHENKEFRFPISIDGIFTEIEKKNKEEVDKLNHYFDQIDFSEA